MAESTTNLHTCGACGNVYNHHEVFECPLCGQIGPSEEGCQ